MRVIEKFVWISHVFCICFQFPPSPQQAVPPVVGGPDYASLMHPPRPHPNNMVSKQVQVC